MIATSLTCMALAVYFEARSEPLDAQLAVAEVIINRANHPHYPDTICGVVSEDKGPKAYDCQFSFMCDGKHEIPLEAEAWGISQQIASEALAGEVLNHGATHYHTTAVSPSWAGGLTKIGSIGTHVFYTDGKCFLSMGCSLRPKARPQ